MRILSISLYLRYLRPMMDKQREFLSMGLLLVDGAGSGGSGSGSGGSGKTFINGEIVKVDKHIYT
jgi:hypothetical protein